MALFLSEISIRKLLFIGRLFQEIHRSRTLSIEELRMSDLPKDKIYYEILTNDVL